MKLAKLWRVTYYIDPKRAPQRGRLEAMFSFEPKPEHVVAVFKEGLTFDHETRMKSSDYRVEQLQIYVPSNDFVLQAL